MLLFQKLEVSNGLYFHCSLVNSFRRMHRGGPGQNLVARTVNKRTQSLWNLYIHCITVHNSPRLKELEKSLFRHLNRFELLWINNGFERLKGRIRK